MEFWDGWDNFLKVIASDHNLTVEQKAVFLVRFARQNIDKKNQDVADEVIGGEPAKALRAYDKRMKDIFGKLAESFPEVKSEDKGKVKRVQAYLEKAYLEQQQNKDTEAGSAIASHDWTKICRDMLESQKLNIRRQATEVVSKAFYVELGLVERKHQPRRSGDFSVSPEQGSGFFQLHEEEITQTYEHEEFLEQVIKQGQSKKSQGRRIAIIGEPGAGKTTLLEAIAFSPKTPGFPIWVSLGSLRDKSLEEYLRQKWLKDALKTSDVTEQQKELENLFKSGQVLLLLDGVDEMPASSPVEALAKLREELTGWVADARTVLTCRQNVWDASVNALPGFDTYRTLDFSYGESNKPDQVRQFICEWFSKAEKPELGERLREKLDEDRHQRIRDLVKNPLRLSLLCQSWYFRQGDLPKTKAALYEQFTQAFYDWKQEQFSTTGIKRKELNTALGLLARKAIDKEKSRFAIRESFAIDVMGEDLFKLATEKLHWLNFVYKDAETDEKVYAFFHPTFQEYFAACVIDDWDYFLNHNNDNPNPFLQYKNKDCVYRIFEPQWKEVILLWIGIEKDEEFRKHKDNFIKALVNFMDGCKNLYWYRTCFLAAAGTAEFRNCKLADLILLIFYWGFEKWEDPNFDPIAEAAREIILEIDHPRAINQLIYYRDNSQNRYISEEATYILEKMGIRNQPLHSISELPPLTEEQKDQLKEYESIIEQALNERSRTIESMLGRIQAEPGATINFLVQLMDKNTNNEIIVEAFKKVLQDKHLRLIVKKIKEYVDIKLEETEYFDYLYDVIWHCTQNMTYPEFYKAWHGERCSVQGVEN
ncbi:NACHT domain-containing protein [Trichocoleus sp. DQ-A3]|uniref:NACHT domain-containing protein n=1 Tax=Cyanophyceae TaxID=3028117 RepID=UPI0016852494|nr:NACHT domain-containing protein [Coleofasciculus sp. FACHB-125]MBD1902393.1 NACHT domain-containing protein [Coleofasciculus sp. FACHB-125]